MGQDKTTTPPTIPKFLLGGCHYDKETGLLVNRRDTGILKTGGRMMATESPRERSDEAIVTSVAATTVDTDSHNVDHPQVNGDATATDDIENKIIADVIDDLVNSTEVSISGSDNEAKSDASKLKDGEKGHIRTSSAVKKPASFKAISVNKTFLHTKGATSTVPAKPVDKAAPATITPTTSSGTLTTSRPRLVVKSGSGGLVAKTSGANGKGTTPDPNAVWNKNRPAPPPAPKNYTDEELKKYGIHMASRLQTNDSKGQTNWADIDDDDEDWAPDDITWKDGTKIAIPHAEEHHAVPPRQPTPIAAASTPAPVQAAPRLIAKENGIPEKPKPTPAAPIKTDVLTSRKGLVLKGAPEKPTLVAKPPAPPTPVKSPWAPLPKVDKVPPVATEAPTHGHLTTKLPPKDTLVSKSVTPPPPKEIAADDFRRDAPGAVGRELYDSKSGRYEPVADRRGSLRPDAQHGRQPALLQRSSNHEHASPIEGAFQPGRIGEQPYGRRRGSSNVSGSSHGQAHRMEIHRLETRPPSARQELGHERLSGSPIERGTTPHLGDTHLTTGPTKASPALSHATPHHPDGRVSTAISADSDVITEKELNYQKKIMHEARLLAMRRRIEEEEREEAARKERIRLKLEALGPAPESKSAKKAATKSPAPTQEATPAQPVTVQTRQPVSTVSPQQLTPTEEKKSVEKAPSKAPSTTATESVKSDSTPKSTASKPVPPAETTANMRPQAARAPAHPWPSAPTQPERYSAASSWGSHSTSKNVWGAPNNNRSLGNGTFIADLGPTQTAPLPNKTGPGPIAPPSSTRPQQSSAPGAITRQPPIAPPKSVSGRLTAHERDARAAAWTAASLDNEAKFNDILTADYEERTRKLQQEGRTLLEAQAPIRDTWRPSKPIGSARETTVKQSIRLDQTEKSWVGPSETKAATTQQASSVTSAAASDYSQRTHSTAPGPASIIAANNAAPQPTRGSRFFPTRDRAETSSEAPVARSPSPPPPDMAGHPAWEGDSAHPHVSLPRPAVVVKLPPAAPTGPRASAVESKVIPQAPASMTQPPTFGWASQAAYREHEPAQATAGASQNWQAKINNLLGTGTSTGKSGGPRSPIERSHHTSQHLTTSGTAPVADNGSVTTKDPAEQCFEEQEMGSLPPVRLPKEVPDMLWQPSPATKPLPKKLYPQPTSADAITFPPGVQGNGNVWRVAFPGFNKDIVVPFGRSRSNPRRGGPRGGGGRHPPSGPQGRGGRNNREGGSSYTHDQGSLGASGSSGPSNRNNRGGYRGGRDRDRDTWTRATPIQT